MANPHKRQRVSNYDKYFTSHWASDDLTSRLDLIRCIDKVHAADGGVYIKNLLLQLALSQPEVAASLEAEEAALPAQQMLEQDHKFDLYEDKVNAAINQDYSEKSEEKQHSEASAVYHDVVMMIDTISEEVCAKHISRTTQRSAFQALLRIGWTICETNDSLGDGVRKLFQKDTTFQDALRNILEILDNQESASIRRSYDALISFHEGVKSLMDAVADDDIFTGLDQVLQQLSDMVERRNPID